MKKMVIIGIVAALSGMMVSGKDRGHPFNVDDQVKILDSLKQSVVIVHYHLKYDKGAPPEGVYSSYMCPNCGRRHTSNSGKNAIREERPLDRQGYLIDDTTIVTSDLKIHPRFLKSIDVSFKGHTVPAEIVSFAVKENAVFLRLKKPLKGSKPMHVDKKASGPFFTVVYALSKASWGGTVSPLSMSVTANDISTSVQSLQAESVIVNSEGTPVAITFNGELPIDDSWKGSPDKWPVIKADKMAKLVARLKQHTAAVLPMVQIKLRSPDVSNDSRSKHRFDYGDDKLAEATEVNALGMVVDPKQVWILRALPPRITARIESVTIFKADGKKVPATFAYNLKDYGIIVVNPEETFDETIKLDETDARKLFNQLVLKADLRVTSKHRIVYALHDRIISAEHGWRNDIYPRTDSMAENSFVFDLNNRLLIAPIPMQIDNMRHNYYSRDDVLPMQSSQLKRLIGNLPALVDPNSVPLSETEAARIAWMGVELQEMTPELARANNVTEETKDGKTGALVNFVFPDSPAAKAGIKPGMILLRLLVADTPRPIDIKIDTEDDGRYEQIMLDPRLDTAPVEYLNDMPTPWKNLENDFTILLTKMGFNKKYTAEFYDQGKVIRKQFKVEKSPVHYGAAKRQKNMILGVTVKPLTFEVRRYLKKTQEDPGVIICKVETGSKGDVAGLKPYEVITTVNKKPVKSMKDFNRVIQKNTELLLTVERLNKMRQVRISPDKK